MAMMTLNYKKTELRYNEGKVVAGDFWFEGHNSPFWIIVREELPEGGIMELIKSMGTGFLNQKDCTLTMNDRDFARKGLISFDQAEKLTESQLAANWERWSMESRGWDDESRDWKRDLNR